MTKKNDVKKQKILLGLLPYWDPMIPPNGIATLKGFLQNHGYVVKTIDLIVRNEVQNCYEGYFEILEKCVPESNRGNFYNIGHEVLQPHMTAHFHYRDEKAYIELVKDLIYKTYYVKINDDHVHELNCLLDHLFAGLERYLVEAMEKEKPDVFGLTVYKGTLPSSMFAFRLIKQRYPHIKTVMGGTVFSDSHAVGSPNYEMVLEKTGPYIDKIILGQGELLFLKYLRGELPESQRVYTKKDINGEILDFESVAFPDYTDFDVGNYPYLPATGSSSCPYQCNFCNSATYWGKFRKKDPELLVEEMIKLYKKYGVQLFFMTDAMLNPVIDELSRGLLESGFSFYYDSYFRVDEPSGDIDRTLLWRRGGLYRVRLGVESGSQRILDAMNKQVTPDQIKTALAGLAYAGVKTTAYWLVGYPGETEEEFQMTLDLLEELKDDIWQAECTPFTYHHSGQAGSDSWKDKRTLLYSEDVEDMIVSKNWTLDCYPPREEAFSRLFRIVRHCKELGIPNPYSLQDHYEADMRWKRLHKNAVPSLLEFRDHMNYIDENKAVKMMAMAENLRQDAGNFSF